MNTVLFLRKLYICVFMTLNMLYIVLVCVIHSSYDCGCVMSRLYLMNTVVFLRKLYICVFMTLNML